MRTWDKVKLIFRPDRIFFFTTISILAACLLLGGPLLSPPSAQAAGEQDSLRLELEYYRLNSLTENSPDAPAGLAVLWVETLNGYYTYSHIEQNSGFPTTVEILTGPEDAPAPLPAPVVYPQGAVKDDPLMPGEKSSIYDGRTPIFVRLDAPLLDRDLILGLNLLLCSPQNCIPTSRRLALRIDSTALASLPPIQTQAWAVAHVADLADLRDMQYNPDIPVQPLSPPSPAPAFQAADWIFTPSFFIAELEVSGLLKALLFGFLAGLMLNVMPCVLPVVGIKLTSLLFTSGGAADVLRRARFRQHNLLFSCGILAWFIALALILSAAGLLWGQIFQNPHIIFILLALVFLLGLSMFGIFTLPILDLKAGSAASPRLQPFFSGLLVTLLATPCSGPLLGGVLGWAFQQGPLRMALVFIAVGWGMASPYLLLAAKPSLVRYLPKPGKWMLILERLVGFFLMGTAVYLYNLLPVAWQIPTLVTLLAAALSAWIWGYFGSLTAPLFQRVIAAVVALCIICGAATLAFHRSDEAEAWESFNPATFNALLGQQPMLLEFTADWCPSCKLLEHTTLQPKRILALNNRYRVRSFRVDLTRESPETTALLKALSGHSIPFVALFPAGPRAHSPTILRDIFTPGQLEQAAQQTFGR